MVINFNEIQPKYYSLHPNEMFNYQFNKGISIGYARVEDLKEVVSKIHSLHDWVHEMRLLADRAKSEKRILNAAYYYRMTEFYTLPSDSEKSVLYNKFNKLIYQVFKGNLFKDYSVPYERGFLPTYRFKSTKNNSKGTIIVHGGFDSFIEEFFPLATFLVEKGYEVFMFEGPGQGKALFKHQLNLIPEWEKPVSTILDFFNLTDVILIGISLGGYLGLRAAAYDHRISKVVVFGVIYDFYSARMSTLSLSSRIISKILISLQKDRLFNSLIQKAMKKDPFVNWSYQQSMYVFGVSTPYEVIKRMKQFNLIKISRLIKQDILLLHGEEDNFIPLKMYFKQKKALTAAKSTSGRIFTAVENASHHCQIGNIKLAFDTIYDWIEGRWLNIKFDV
ncbi:MAG: alpha/beta hydrolase [Promethearchaeota archaeon]